MAKSNKVSCERCGNRKLSGELRNIRNVLNAARVVCLDCLKPEDIIPGEEVKTREPGSIELRIRARDPNASPVEKFSGDKYKRGYRGQVFDVYDIIEMWSVTCPALQHAVKKILVPGKRGKNDAMADLKEARDALTRAIELQEMREAK